MAWVKRFRVLVVAVLATGAAFMTAFGQESNAVKAKPFYENGKARSTQGDFEGAIVEFTKALNIDPQSPFVYAARGNARLNLGALDEAIADFSKAIEIDPKRFVPYLNRGAAKVDKGDLDGAIADYSKVIALDPKSAIAYRNRGCALQQKGELDRARSDYQQAIQLATDEGAYQHFYLYLLGQRQKPRPLPMELKATVTRWKESWKKTVGLFLADEIDEAALLAQAAQGSPKAVREQKCEGFYYAGAVKLARGETAGAKELFERCVATQLHTFPEFQLARAELANIGQVEKTK